MLLRLSLNGHNYWAVTAETWNAWDPETKQRYLRYYAQVQVCSQNFYSNFVFPENCFSMPRHELLHSLTELGFFVYFKGCRTIILNPNGCRLDIT